MKKRLSTLLLLISIVYCHSVAQTLVFEKDLGYKNFSGYEMDTINKTYTFSFIKKSIKGDVIYNTKTFDKDFNKLSENSVDIGKQKSVKGYSKETYTNEYNQISKSGKIKIEKISDTYAYNFETQTYDFKKTEILQSIELLNNKTNTPYKTNIYTYDFNKFTYAILKNKKNGCDIVKINSDLTYTNTSLYCDFDDIEKRMAIDLLNGDLYVLGERDKNYKPTDGNNKIVQGYVLMKIDKDLNIKQEVAIEGKHNLKILKINSEIFLLNDKATTIFNADLSIKKTSGNLLIDKIIYYDKNRVVAIPIGITSERAKLLLIDYNLNILDYCTLPADLAWFKMCEPFNLKGNKYLLIGTLIFKGFGSDIQYSLIKYTDNKLTVTKSIKHENIVIPEGDLSNNSAFASDKFSIEEIIVKNKTITEDGDALINMYLDLHNQNNSYFNFPRTLIITPSGDLYCYEVYAMSQSGGINQKSFKYKDNIYWFVFGNNKKTNFGSAQYSPKLACIDGKTKKLKKYLYLENCSVNWDFLYIKSFGDDNTFNFISDKGKIFRVSFD